jgi:hypothetical protein
MSSSPISAFKVLAGLAGLYAGAVTWQHHTTIQGAPADTLHLKHMQHQLEEYREGDYKQGLTPYPWFNDMAREWRRLCIHGPFGLWDELHGVGTTVNMFIKALTSEEGLFTMGCAYAVFGNKMFKPFVASANGLWKYILEPAGRNLVKLISGKGIGEKIGQGFTWLLTTKAGLVTAATAALFYMRFDGVFSGRTNYETWQGEASGVTESQIEAYAGHGG